MVAAVVLAARVAAAHLRATRLTVRRVVTPLVASGSARKMNDLAKRVRDRDALQEYWLLR